MMVTLEFDVCFTDDLSGKQHRYRSDVMGETLEQVHESMLHTCPSQWGLPYKYKAEFSNLKYIVVPL